jgi:hypothetical protein
LPAAPLDQCFVRHTVGLGDPISPAGIAAADRVDDGLPHDLESSIRAYGLRYFKVKLHASAERDFARLRELSAVLEREAGGDYFVTLDGNENFPSIDRFREFWREASLVPELKRFWQRILVVEQPVHRDHALADETGLRLSDWKDRPPLIIDESDGAVGDLSRALQLGYAGTSHKNCKGIVKGLLNAGLLAQQRREGRRTVLTGEDLCNLGPVALLQDLALMALLGIDHVERNGHHYYRGLSMLPTDWQRSVLSEHGDLYERHPLGFPRLRVRDGKLALTSVNAAPFGVRPLLDPTSFQEINS